LNPGAYDRWVDSLQKQVNLLESCSTQSEDQQKWVSCKIKSLGKVKERLYMEAYQHLEEMSRMYLNKSLSEVVGQGSRSGNYPLSDIMDRIVEEMKKCGEIPYTAQQNEKGTLGTLYHEVEQEVATFYNDWNHFKQILNTMNVDDFLAQYKSKIDNYLSNISKLQSNLSLLYADIMFMKYAFCSCDKSDGIIDDYNYFANPLPQLPTTILNPSQSAQPTQPTQPTQFPQPAQSAQSPSTTIYNPPQPQSPQSPQFPQPLQFPQPALFPQPPQPAQPAQTPAILEPVQYAQSTESHINRVSIGAETEGTTSALIEEGNKHYMNDILENSVCAPQNKQPDISPIATNNMQYLNKLGTTGSQFCPPIIIENDNDEAKKQEEIRKSLYEKILSCGGIDYHY